MRAWVVDLGKDIYVFVSDASTMTTTLRSAKIFSGPFDASDVAVLWRAMRYVPVIREVEETFVGWQLTGRAWRKDEVLEGGAHDDVDAGGHVPEAGVDGGVAGAHALHRR